MFNSLKNFAVPAAIGFILHVATFLLSHYVFHQLRSETHVEGNSVFLFYTTDWLNLVHAILPGLAVGLLAKSKPALIGFLSILLSQLFIGVYLQISWFDLPNPMPLIQFGLTTLPPAVFGLVASIAGFAIKQSSNYAIKGTSV